MANAFLQFLGLLSLTLCLLSTCGGQGQQDDTCADSLLDSYVQSGTYFTIGEQLRVKCTLSPCFISKGFTSRDIGFQQYNMNDGDKGKCVPSSEVEILNVTQAVFSKVATLQDQGSVWCFVPKENCSDGETISFVGFTDDITVEYPVQNVTNFSCVVHNWDTMNCSWEHPVPYVNREDINVSFIYMAGRDRGAYSCPSSNLTFTWCSMPIAMVDYFIQINVTIVRTSKTVSRVFTVDTSKIVKPAPIPSSVSAESTKPGCILLHWSYERDYVIFRVKLQDSKNKEDLRLLATNINETFYEACGLPPYSEQTFFIDVYPASIYSGYWSDAVAKMAYTMQTAPSQGPVITPGSYSITDCTADGVRQARFYWKPVPSEFQNGIIDRYVIKLGPPSNTVHQSVTWDSLSMEVLLPCMDHGAITVSLYAGNEAGLSIHPAVWIVQPQTFTAPLSLRESFSVEISTERSRELTSEVVWNYDGMQTDNEITVMMCDRDGSYDWCKGPITWWKGAISHGRLQFPNPISSPRDKLFGFSVNEVQSNRSTGVEWAKCMFVRDDGMLRERDRE